MPLDPKDIRSGPVFQGFDDAVGRGLGDQKICADPAAALVMGAVDQTGGAVEAGEQGRFFTLSRVDLIQVLITVCVRSGQILDQISAKVDVEKLHAPADTEDRPARQEKGVEKGKLGVVKLPVCGVRTLVFLTKPEWVHIASARQQKFIIGRERVRVETGAVRDLAAGERALIIFGVFRNTCDQDVHRIACGDF